MKIAVCTLLLITHVVYAKDQKKHAPLLSAPTDSPRQVRFKKKVDPGALQKELFEAGFAIQFIECSVDNCTIHLAPNEKKDPLPIVNRYVYVDPAMIRQQKLDQMKALQKKWDAGTINSEEKDTLLKMLTALILGA